MSIRLTGMASGLDTDSMVKELVSAYSTKKESSEKALTKNQWTQDAWKSLNTEFYSFYKGNLSKMRWKSTFSSAKTMNVSDPTKAIVKAGTGVVDGTQTVEISQLAKSGYLTGSELSTGSSEDVNAGTKLSDLGVTGQTISLTVSGETKTYSIDPTKTLSEFATDFEEKTGIHASFDSGQKRLIFSSDSGKENDFTLNVTAGNFSDIKALGLATQDNYTDMGEAMPTYAAYKQDGSDAQITINGATFESDSNTITVNGLTVTATGITTSPITITATTDTDGIYDTIKGFFSEYNDVIKSMTTSYNADSARDYAPLTDDEKEDMTDDEIEKWETKIKDSLLRRDTTLSSVMSSMTSAMQQGIEIGGETYHLSDFGIETLGYSASADNEENNLHIAGDEDDVYSADKTDKLKKALSENPDLTEEFFNKLADEFYSTMTKKMGSTTLSSTYTLYNDKDLEDKETDLKETISDWEEKTTDYEDYWYDKFSAMETAMTKLQSETSSLTSLLGSSSSS